MADRDRREDQRWRDRAHVVSGQHADPRREHRERGPRRAVSAAPTPSTICSICASRRCVDDVTASAIREIVGKNVLDFVLMDGRTEVAHETQDLLQATLDSYGAGITRIRGEPAGRELPAQVESSVQDAIKAREDGGPAFSKRSRMPTRSCRGPAARRRAGVQDAEAYRAEASSRTPRANPTRFRRISREYQKRPPSRASACTSRRCEHDARQLDARCSSTPSGSGNVIYLPLDRCWRTSAQRSGDRDCRVCAAAPPAAERRRRARDDRETR